MNKSALKNFAIKAREDLIQQVERRANIFGIDKNTELKVEEKHGQLVVNGKTYPISKREAFRSLNRHLKAKGYNQLIEDVAYTWFNRIIAIRYMEINEYLPERVNVLSSSTGKAEPDILLHYETMRVEVNREEVDDFIKQGKTEEAYRKLFIAQCNQLYEILPFLFKKIDDYTELLLPDFLLDTESVINRLVWNGDLTESFREVEVIGWLYQFYNTEPKNEVFADLKKNKKIEKYQIPAATQLFTPKWIVQYMVENSLGQIWLESNPDSTLKSFMKYYIEPAVQEEKVQDQLEEICYKNVNLEEVKIIDPCVGSGHILVYAFDLLYQMYEEMGYLVGDIPQLILEKNLYGLDIDDRAIQLASFALIMKARSRSSKIFRSKIDLNICSIQESNEFPIEAIDYLLNTKDTEIDKKVNRDEIEYLINIFYDAKEYGSLLEVKPIDFEKLEKKLEEIRLGEIRDIFELQYKNIILENIIPLIKQGKLMSNKYDVVCTNPPYMGIRKGMNSKLIKYVDNFYQKQKYDLFSVFIERANRYGRQNAFIAMITQHAWMFLSSFEDMRRELIKLKTIISMVHLGSRAFEEIGGEVVQTVSFVLRNHKINNYLSCNHRLLNYNSTIEKENIFLNKDEVYYSNQERYSNIPGSPIAYWLNEAMELIFSKAIRLGELSIPKQGMATTDNNRFLRFWSEVKNEKIGFGIESNEQALHSKKKWFPYNKGGEFRKWYGNNEYLVNWESDGKEVKELATYKYKSYTRAITNIQYFFKESITWSFISSGNFGVRYSPTGFIFDVGGSSIFPDKNYRSFLMGLLCSKISTLYMSIYNPTLNFQVGNVADLPIILTRDDITREKIELLVDSNINISKRDWDSFETSWDFKKHPFIQNKTNLSNVFMEWNEFVEKQFNQLKDNEEELNRIFIDLYGLEKELTPEVEDKDITIRKADRLRDTKSFLSYFIGCVMGRYSLAVDGLAYAGGEWDESKYQTFKPNKYGIILLTDERYFENDIITRLREFLKVAFGPETVEENLKWIAESLELKRGETEEERLRRYFLDELFSDHTKVYKKRPIYWLVDSGKQKGLRTIVYMHRYEPATMATIRFEHLQEIQGKYHNETTAIETRLSNPNLSASEKRELDKKKDSYKKKIDELVGFDKQLAVYANQQINIDLDDGVAVNYVKFDKVLAKIK